jgi:hypothetical protein
MMTVKLGRGVVSAAMAFALVGLGAFLQSTFAQTAATAYTASWKVRHFAVVVKDAEKAGKAFAEAFGVPVPTVRLIPNSSVVFDKDYCKCDPAATIKNASLKVGDNFQFDLVEPTGGSSTWREVLDKRGEYAIHHVSMTVPDVKQAIGEAQKRGGRLVLTDPNGGGQYAYVFMPQLGFNFEIAK